MLACLLISNRDDRSVQVSELLAFYLSRWELADSDVIYIDLDSIGDQIRVLDLDSIGDQIHALIHDLKRREVQARIGVAPTRFASFVAAHAADLDTPLFVSPLQLEDFLADQSVSYLPISSENRERLGLLGLQRLGQIARIDVRQLVNQFGKEGQLMSELVRGIDPTPLRLYRPSVEADDGAWQMGVWEDPANVKPHRQPVSVTVIPDDKGYPQAFLVGGVKIFISDIIDFWKIENRWWTGQRTNCEYFEIVKLGAKSTSILCHNLDHAEWCIH